MLLAHAERIGLNFIVSRPMAPTHIEDDGGLMIGQFSPLFLPRASSYAIRAPADTRGAASGFGHASDHCQSNNRPPTAVSPTESSSS